MTHGQTRGRKQSRLYRIWSCMKTRVKNPNRSARTAAESVKCGRTNIVEALSGRSETASGYHWKYVDDKKGAAQ